jgi:hypothetical protein
MMRLGMRRLAPGVLAAIAALSVVLRVGVLLNRRIDPDESQHLHVAWLITQGQVPYRDFWEHTFRSSTTPWRPSRCGSRAAGRLLRRARRHGAPGRRRGVADVALARRLSADGAVWAVVILALAPQFAETSTETRPDVPALVAHLASLLALATGARAAGRRRLWAAGAWQGAALGLSLKAVFALAGALALVAASPSGARGRGRIGSLARFLAGMALVLGALFGGLVLLTGTDTLPASNRDVVRDSLRFVDFGKTWPCSGARSASSWPPRSASVWSCG